MTTKTFDPSKPVQTRDGRKARIICTDGVHPNHEYRIWALVSEESEQGPKEYAIPYSSEGVFEVTRGSSGHDLVNVPEKKSEFYGKTWNGFRWRLHGIRSISEGFKAHRASSGERRYKSVIELVYEDDVLIEAKEHFRDKD